MISFGNALSDFFKKYYNFSGRASRSMYWWAMLFLLVVNVFIETFQYFSTTDNLAIDFFDVVGLLFLFVMVIPTLSINVRRLHDTGHGGGWIFISLIPLVGQIWYLILMLQPSEEGDNRFGPQP